MVSVGVGILCLIPPKTNGTPISHPAIVPLPAGGYTRMRVGLDIGSTTIKCVVLNDAGEILF